MRLGAEEQHEECKEMGATDEVRCGCGYSEMTLVTEAKEPCGCGCACCDDGGTPRSTAQEIEELNRLRASIEARLEEFGQS